MAKSLILFVPIEARFLEELILSFQEEFDQLLEETFSDDELEVFEKDLNALGALYPGPLPSEISFDDFITSPQDENLKRLFFEGCKSGLSIENLPYLESSPFQVTYLQELLKKFEQVLIDQGGFSELVFKDKFLQELESFKNIDSLFARKKTSTLPAFSLTPVEPIDFLVLDVYKELDRLRYSQLPNKELPDNLQKILFVMSKNKMDPATLYQKSGLTPKDFDDGLERLKFWLRKL